VPDKRGTEDTPLVVRPDASTAKRYDEEAHEKQEDREERAHAEFVAEAIGLATIAILAIQALAFFVQAQRLRESIDEMKTATSATENVAAAARESAAVARDTLIATRRPLMTLEIKLIGDYHASDSGFGLQVSTTAQNTGETPAMNVAIGVDFIRKREFGESDEAILDAFATDRAKSFSESEIVFPKSHSTCTEMLRNFQMPPAPPAEWTEFVAWIRYGMMFDDRKYFTAILFTLYHKGSGGMITPQFRGRVSKENLAVIKRAFIT
jgi:hypothetical protein